MPIPMNCPSCGRAGKLPDNFQGGKVKCPGCGVINEVPGAQTAPKNVASPPPPAAKTKPVLQAFNEAKPTPPAPAPTPPKPAARPAAPSSPPTAKPPVAKKPPVSHALNDFDELDEDDMEPAYVAPSPMGRSVGTRPRHDQQESSNSNMPILLAVGGGGALVLAALVAFMVLKQPTPDLPTAADPPIAGGRGPTQNANYADNGNDAASPSFARAPMSSPSSSPSPSLSPEEAIRRVHDATVYVKVKTAKGRGTGSGFVIRNDPNNTVLIATNRHVISSHDDDDDDDEPAKKGQKSSAAEPTITVVFRSGEGSGKEQELPAVVLGKDSSGDPSRDLAILSVQNVTNPPKPLEFNRTGEPALGMELKIYGFPFGQMLNVANRGNPAITVNRASVASLRRDGLGHIALIQVDGSVNPGNSGGPVVDGSGRLVGVTVMKLSVADGVGLAIPAAHVDEIMAGRPGKWTVRRLGGNAQSLELEVAVELADPFSKLKSLTLKVAPTEGTQGKPAPNAPPPSMVNATSVPLVISPDHKTATAKLTVPAASGFKAVLVQYEFVNGDSRTYSSVPSVHVVPPGNGLLMAEGERDSELEARIRKTMDKLGELIDPDKDCKMTRDSKTKTIKIDVPGKLHSLSPQLLDKKKQPKLNAPRMLADISGDFITHVRVAGDMRPGIDAPNNPKTGKALPITFQGAGLILWEDENNFVRLERTVGTAGQPVVVNRLLVEVYKHGKEAGHPYYIDVPEGPMSLMMIRKDGRIRCLFGNDGKRWTMMQEIAADFPDKIKIGLSATNISKKAFTAQFENIILIDDKEKIAEEFDKEDK